MDSFTFFFLPIQTYFFIACLNVANLFFCWVNIGGIQPRSFNLVSDFCVKSNCSKYLLYKCTVFISNWDPATAIVGPYYNGAGIGVALGKVQFSGSK
jgi:hypothetical protein